MVIRSGHRTASLLLALIVSLSLIPLSVLAQAASQVIIAPSPAVQGTPSGEQTLRIAGPAEGPYSLDPAFSRDLGSAFILRQIFRGLTRLDDQLQPVPELAERIEISGDGLTYRFTLRAGATFQNGAPITPADVIESFSRAVRPSTAAGDITRLGGPTFLSDIAGFDAVVSGDAQLLSGLSAEHERDVVIRLSSPRSSFLAKLATAPASIIDPANVASGPDWWRTPNGSGPFQMSEWQPDDHLTFTAYEGFVLGAPYLERIEVRLGASALQPFNLFQSGEIDLVGVGTTSLDRVLAPRNGFTDDLQSTPLFAVDYIAFRTDVEPLDDPNIRRAIQLGFPRERIATVTYDGYVEEATGIVPHGMLDRRWDSTMLEFDPEAARAAIAASRYKTAEQVPPIRVFVSGYGGAEQLRDSLFETTGLRIEVIDVEWTSFVDGLSNRQYSAYELYWGADYPDPEAMLSTLFGTGKPDNYIAYSNAEFDRLLAEAAETLDVDRRAALYLEAQQFLIDDGVLLPLYFDVSYTLVAPHVMNLHVTPMGVMYLDAIWLEL